MILVTAYLNPDIDGTACAYAYAELLCAVSGLSGRPSREAEYVLDFLHVSIHDAEEIIPDCESVVLVDASDPIGISQTIPVGKVTEIIDHRKAHDSGRFPNAKVQIELVGAAATLVAERFMTEGIRPSHKSAALLYCAIVSNTINFKATLTTERDRKAAEWLEPMAKLPESFVHEMFAAKSNLTGSIHEIFLSDLAAFTFGGKKISIMQLEIVDAGKFVETRLKEIRAELSSIKAELQLDHIFLTCIDVERGGNVFVAEARTQELLSEVLGLEFKGKVAAREGIIMRKEIVPMIKEKLEK